jgi:DNA-binding XRE family transcriptional regulator
MRIEVMVAQSLKLAGKEFVIVSKSDFERLKRRAAVIDEVTVPALPPPLPDGTYPALKAGRALLAQKLIRRRWSLGLSQAEVARRARIRPETLNRIEKARVTADSTTVAKVVRVLESVERKQARGEGGS